MKKKVALCMRGAVGKHTGDFFVKGSLYNNGKYINYIQCYNSIVKHIIDTNKDSYEIDIFQHCWNKDLENELVELYKPKAYLFEDNNIYSDEISSLCSTETDFGGISQALTIKKSLEIKEYYEQINNIQYDIVILYRYDILLWKDINLKEYDPEKIYVNAHPDSNGDFHFIMNNQNATMFKYLYDSLKYNNPHYLHHWIKRYVNVFMGKNLYMDSILPGVHQEVYRKIHDCSINQGYLSIETFNSYLDPVKHNDAPADAPSA